jgi:hypothetical protein
MDHLLAVLQVAPCTALCSAVFETLDTFMSCCWFSQSVLHQVRGGLCATYGLYDKAPCPALVAC